MVDLRLEYTRFIVYYKCLKARVFHYRETYPDLDISNLEEELGLAEIKKINLEEKLKQYREDKWSKR